MVHATSEEAKETASVGVMQEQLRALQADVDAASRRLAVTRARVEMNMKRVDELRAEAVRSALAACIRMAAPACPALSYLRDLNQNHSAWMAACPDQTHPTSRLCAP